MVNLHKEIFNLGGMYKCQIDRKCHLGILGGRLCPSQVADLTANSPEELEHNLSGVGYTDKGTPLII